MNLDEIFDIITLHYFWGVLRLYECTRTVLKDFFVPSVNIELLISEILHVTCSKYIRELSRSVTCVNIELLHRVILYVYS